MSKILSIVAYGKDSVIPVIQYHGIPEDNIHSNLNCWKWWRTTDWYSYASNIASLDKQLGGIRRTVFAFDDGKMAVTDPRFAAIDGKCVLDSEEVWEDFVNNYPLRAFF